MSEILGKDKNNNKDEYRNGAGLLAIPFFGIPAYFIQKSQQAKTDSTAAAYAITEQAAYQAEQDRLAAEAAAEANMAVVNKIAPYAIGGIVLIVVGIIVYKILNKK